MSLTRYLEGILTLGLLVGPHLATGWWWRRRLVPGWSGAPAALAQAVLSISSIVLTAEVLGTVGAFRTTPLVVGGLVVLLVSVVTVRRRGGLPPRPPREGDSTTEITGWLTIGGVVGLTMAQAGTYAVDGARRGILDPDSLIYHLPFAARFVQSGSLTSFHFVYPEFPWHLNPGSGELFHAFGMLAFDNESLSPVINVVWLAFALLAGWCIGLPFGRAPLTLLSTAMVVDAPVMINAGAAGNDVTAVALVLAAVALLVRAPRWTRAQLLLAGLAAGLAVSVKLPALPTIGLLVILVLVVMPRRALVRAGPVWVGAFLLTGSYWYARNLLRTGSPLSSVAVFGFPSAPFAIVDRLGFSVADYLRHPSLANDVLVPLTHFAWGPLWGLPFVLALGGAAVGVLDRDRLLRVVAIAAIVAMGVWLVTPTTALGPFGSPGLFPSNSRYVAPALAVALALLPASGRLRSRGATVVLAVLFAVGLVAGALNSSRASWVTNELRDGLLIGAASAAAVALAYWWRRAPRPKVTIAAAVVALLVMVAGGRWFTRLETENAYRTMPLAMWARNLPPSRIAVESGAPIDWLLYGSQFENTVEPVGVAGPHGAFHFISDCTRWRRALRDGRFDFLVVTRDLDQLFARDLETWIASDAGLQQVLGSSGEPVAGSAQLVYRIDRGRPVVPCSS